MPRARPRVESSTSVLISCAARMYPAQTEPHVVPRVWSKVRITCEIGSARTAHRRPRRRYCLRNFRPERDFCAVHWPWPSVHTPYRPGPRRGTACILCTRSPGPGDEVVVGALRRRWRASWTTEIASHMPRARPRVESSTSVLISCAARMYPA